MYETDALMNPFGMGLHLDRAAFEELLRRSVRDAVGSQEQMHVVRAKFMSAERQQHGWEVVAEDLGNHQITSFCSRLLIDATGRRASVARKVSLCIALRTQLTLVSAGSQDNQSRFSAGILRRLRAIGRDRS